MIADCFEFSDDPETPLAIDGVFGPDDTFWRGPMGDQCPADNLSPAANPETPYVAFSFCNNDTVSHFYDFEVRVYEGPNGEAALDDPILYLYDGQGVPADRRQCLFANDDVPDGIGVTDSLIEGFEVAPGQAITTVATPRQYDASRDIGTGYYILVVTNVD